MEDDRVATNRRMWDELAAIHPEIDFYELRELSNTLIPTSSGSTE